MKKVFLYILIIFGIQVAKAQSTVQAEISQIQMLIGHQVEIKVSALTKESAKVTFPAYKPLDMITPGIEVVKTFQMEKEALDNNSVKHTCIYTVTSFDDTLYYIPPFVVDVDGKKIESESLALKVLTVEVDTTNMDKFFGPNDVQDNPFMWKDWELIFWLGVLAVVLFVLLLYFVLILKQNKPISLSIKVVKKLLPHQKAMKEIEQIKADKMVTSDNQKEYYTKLTDTLRIYIEERYGFNAMEMTSSEIIDRLTKAADTKGIDELRILFNTADLVKFAKYSTLINENDMNLVNAIDFINSTKLENMPTEEVVKQELTKEDERTIETRKILKTVIIVGGIILLVLIGYVLHEIYLLVN